MHRLTAGTPGSGETDFLFLIGGEPSRKLAIEGWS
jgi:hypothetical protein